MNCKPGDLAVIVRSIAGNEGKIVRCVTPVFMDGILGAGMRWVTDPPLPDFLGNGSYPPLDANMRPIRDNDGADETLTWASKPEGVTA
jgi:hypothetical protein